MSVDIVEQKIQESFIKEAILGGLQNNRVPKKLELPRL